MCVRAPRFAQEAEIIICKQYLQSVMLTAVLFQGKFLVTLSDASKEQPLVDSVFVPVTGRRRGFQVRAYDHAWFAKLSLWESETASAEEQEAEEAASAAAAAALATSTLDLTGEGYTQTYIVMRPKNLAEGSTVRNVFFRFGGWCYSGQVRARARAASGECVWCTWACVSLPRAVRCRCTCSVCGVAQVDLGVDVLHLGDVPEVLPALQRQQSNLAFTCETSAVPTTSRYAPVLVAMRQAMGFFEAEIVASEAFLTKMAELGITAWIEEDWGAAFFELSTISGREFDVRAPLRNVCHACVQ